MKDAAKLKNGEVSYGGYRSVFAYERAKKRDKNRFPLLWALISVLIVAMCVIAAVVIFAQSKNDDLKEDARRPANTPSNGEIASPTYESPSDGIFLAHVSEPKTQRESAEGVVSEASASIVDLTVSEKNRIYNTGGIILTEDGYVLTLLSSIAGERNIKARLSSGSDRGVHIVGVDEELNIAVLKLDSKGYTPAHISEFSSLSVGEMAYVLSPVAEPANYTTATLFTKSETSGSLHYLGRSFESSGLPVIDIYGNFVSILSASDGAVTSIDALIPRVNEIIQNDHKSDIIGGDALDIYDMSVRNLYKKETSLYNLPCGIKVVSIANESDIWYAGLRVNDIIVSFNQSFIYSVDDFAKYQSAFPSGFLAKLTVFRNGSFINIFFLTK